MMALSALRLPLGVIAPINEAKEILNYVRFSIAQRSQECMANSPDPDKTTHFAASFLGLRYL